MSANLRALLEAHVSEWLTDSQRRGVNRGHGNTMSARAIKRHGNFLETTMPTPEPRRLDLPERFWANVVKLPDAPGCWLWIGQTLWWGHGRYGRTGETLAHRLSWMNARGPIPAGMFVCHHCDTPPCVNPEHLYVGTHADNMHDRDKRGRGVVPRLRGERHGLAKLSDENVAAILSSTDSRRTLAKRFGVSYGTIGGILRRDRWTHVQGSAS